LAVGVESVSHGDAPPLPARLAGFAVVFFAIFLVVVFIGGMLFTVSGEPEVLSPAVVIGIAWMISLVVATIAMRPRAGALLPLAAILLVIISAPLSWIAFVLGHVIAGGDLGFGND
jgi:hypothetical protein